MTRREYLLWIGSVGILGVQASQRSHALSVAAAALQGEDVIAQETIKIGRSEIRVDFAFGHLDLPRDAVVEWIKQAADAVAAFYGQFPVVKTRVLVLMVAGRKGIVQGTTWGDPVPFTRMRLGEHTTEEDLHTDWEMTHEFVHLAFPSVSQEHHWLEEGLATYVEPLARAQIGLIQSAEVWRDMVRDMPQGEPGPLDRGLDRTHSWGRTYWGGAMFCLLADVQIRKRSVDQKGLRDALRAIVHQGGTIQVQWPLNRAFRIGDAATGTSVLMDLYEEMGRQAVPVDLDALWMKLGVKRDGGDVEFDDHAPLAAVRQQIVHNPSH